MTSKFSLYGTGEAAKMLGVAPKTVRRLIAEGKLKSDGMIGRSFVFTEESIAVCRDRFYNDGMSISDIGEVYGKPRTLVDYYFVERLHVKPAGINNKRGGARVYEPSTVAKFAKILNWEPVTPQNRTGE